MNTKKILAAAAALLLPVAAFAELGSASASNAMNTFQQTLRELTTGFTGTISIILGMISIGMLAWGAIKYYKSDGNSNDALIKIGVGMLIIVILFNVAKALFW